MTRIAFIGAGSLGFTRGLVRDLLTFPLLEDATIALMDIDWWFRKRPDLIEKYCIHGTGWNPGEYAYILKEYQNNEATWKDQAREWFAADRLPPSSCWRPAAAVCDADESQQQH